MPINLPATIQGECDGCGEEIEFDSTQFVGSPESVGVEELTIKEQGWWLNDGELYCPDCRVENGYEEEDEPQTLTDRPHQRTVGWQSTGNSND